MYKCDIQPLMDCRLPYNEANMQYEQCIKAWKCKQIEICLVQHIYTYNYTVYVNQVACSRVNAKEYFQKKKRSSMEWSFLIEVLSAVATLCVSILVKNDTGNIADRSKISSLKAYKDEVEVTLIVANEQVDPVLLQWQENMYTFPNEIKIKKTLKRKLQDDKFVVIYEICATTNNVKTTVQRRYQEFYLLDWQIRLLFQKNHLLSSLPSLPKRASAWKNHFDEDFVYTRRIALEYYLNRLLQFNSILSLPIFMSFIDINAINGDMTSDQCNWQFNKSNKLQGEKQIKLSKSVLKSIPTFMPDGYQNEEIKVTYMYNGPIGLDLTICQSECNTTSYATVRKIKASSVSHENYTTSLQNVQCGYLLTRVNSMSCIDMSLDSISSLILCCKRPCNLYFVRPATPAEEEPIRYSMEAFPRLE